MRTRSKAVCVVAAMVIAAACGGGGGKNAAPGASYPTTPTTPSTPPPANTVVAGKDLQFNPTALTVQRGVPISFVLEDSVHAIYFVGTGKPDDLPTASNQTIQRTFTVAGSFTMLCRNHAYMTGVITVQ